MRTNIEIDDGLMAKVMKSGQFSTKRAAVEEGLRMLAQRDAAQQLLAMGGKTQWIGDLNAWRTDKPQRVRVST